MRIACCELRCDKCGELYVNPDTGFAIFPDESALNDDIQGADRLWQNIDGKWYCPDCVDKLFIQDEETGEYRHKDEGEQS